jgi:hypothetical protein
MFVTIGLDEHHLYGNVFLDLDCGRIVLTLDVDHIRADFIVSADNVEDPMDLGRGSGPNTLVSFKVWTNEVS